VTTPTTGIKCTPLTKAEELIIISKVDGTPNARRIKTAEELGIAMTTLNTIMPNRNKILEQSLSAQLDKKKIKIAKYEKVERVLMEWFRQRWALIADVPILKRKTEKTVMKLGTEFRPSSGWIDRFKNDLVLSIKKFVVRQTV
jgi:hypothetical protein